VNRYSAWPKTPPCSRTRPLSSYSLTLSRPRLLSPMVTLTGMRASRVVGVPPTGATTFNVGASSSIPMRSTPRAANGAMARWTDNLSVATPKIWKSCPGRDAGTMKKWF